MDAIQVDEVVTRLQAASATETDFLQVAWAAARVAGHELLRARIASLAPSDATWDRRFLAISIYVEFLRGTAPNYALLDRLVIAAPFACSKFLWHGARDAYTSKILVFYARSVLKRWVHGARRPWMRVDAKASAFVSNDAEFLHHAAKLRAGVEVVALASHHVSDAAFAERVCTARPLYAGLARGSALDVVTRLLTNPVSAFVPGADAGAEVCLADEVLLIASLDPVHVTEHVITRARMLGCIERARVMAAMHAPLYDPRARVRECPRVPDVTAADVEEARAVRAVRDAPMHHPTETSFRPLPARLLALLRRTELELRYHAVTSWYGE